MAPARKSRKSLVTLLPKRLRARDQIGGGEVEKPQADDDGPCQLTSAYKIT